MISLPAPSLHLSRHQRHPAPSLPAPKTPGTISPGTFGAGRDYVGRDYVAPCVVSNMRPRLLFAVIVLCALGYSPELFAQFSTTIPNAMSLNDAIGRDFWIAIPPNEVESHPTEALEVHLVATSPALVTVTDAFTGATRSYTLGANEVRALSHVRGEITWSSEIRETEQPTPKAIHITSSTPITVYVLNSKQYSHDGYRALPTHVWGREYIPISYYDFKEFAEWAGGFVIIASEPTTVDIQLRGTGLGVAKTMGGRDLNTSITVTLQAGEVYMVRGDGKSRGQFDLSGSLIRSDKPVGVLAFHMKTSMPNLLSGGGRQHLVEMCQPVSTWGTQTGVIEFTRLQPKGPGSGDVFRVVASEPSTRWSVTSYDRGTKNVLSKDGGSLINSGNLADITQSVSPTALISGFSIWESTKPTRVVQYATSWTWDYNTNLDPLMIECPSIQAGVQRATFATSNNPRFTSNHLSLIIKADPSAPTYLADLESVTLDGVPVWSHPLARLPRLKSNLVSDGIHFAVVETPSNGTMFDLQQRLLAPARMKRMAGQLPVPSDQRLSTMELLLVSPSIRRTVAMPSLRLMMEQALESLLWIPLKGAAQIMLSLCMMLNYHCHDLAVANHSSAQFS
ncbi:MAG: IgGFc-binding protein [Candidatus Kapabacteria bacterium]|nr:IgGFc-binding protein [Candidatus Kapabacteria bacterium]